MKYNEVVLLIVDFMKNNNIKEDYPMPVNEVLIREMGNYLGYTKGKSIRVVPIDTSNNLILGKLRHFTNRVDIAINEKLNNCWKRFVITKELSHLLMSKNSEGITENMETLIDGLFSHSFGTSDDISHEKLALYMAFEYLMPYNISKDILNSDKSDLEIARLFSIPENVVKAFRNKEFLNKREDSYKIAFEKHPIIS